MTAIFAFFLSKRQKCLLGQEVKAHMMTRPFTDITGFTENLFILYYCNILFIYLFLFFEKIPIQVPTPSPSPNHSTYPLTPPPSNPQRG